MFYFLLLICFLPFLLEDFLTSLTVAAGVSVDGATSAASSLTSAFGSSPDFFSHPQVQEVPLG